MKSIGHSFSWHVSIDVNFIFRGTATTVTEDLENIVEDENCTNPEENSEHFLAIIIECLALLNKIPEAVEVKRDMKL